MSRFVPLAAVLAVLAFAAPASAKRAVAATVCGASECRNVTDRGLLDVLTETEGPTKPPDRPSGWYRATIVFSGEGERAARMLEVVPEAGTARGYDGVKERYMWWPMSSAAGRAYREIVRGLQPLSASSVPGLDERPPPTPFPWAWVAGGGAAILLAGGVVARRRRRPGSRRARIAGSLR